MREIRGKNSNPQSLYSLIGHLGHNDAALQRFAGLLEDSSLSSVDIFLEHRSDLAEIGKAATAAAHMHYESERRLRGRDEKMRWYEHLWDRLVADTGAPTFSKNKLSVVTFNYDRSLEAFLHTAMTTLFESAGETLWAEGVIPIEHVHGSLGPYDPGNENEHQPYSSTVTHEDVDRAAGYIRIVSDPDDDEVVQCGNKLIADAERVCFLGFSYHEANIVKLASGLSESAKALYGTAVGMGQGIREEAIRHLRQTRRSGKKAHTMRQIDDQGRGALRFLEHAGVLV